MPAGPGGPFAAPPRRRRNRAAVTAVVVAVVSGAVVGGVLLVMFLRGAWLYLGDLFDSVEPPEASAEVGEWFTTDDGDLRIKVTSLECLPTESGHGQPGDVSCTFAFDIENHGDHAVSLNDITVKSVVDGDWASADVSDPADPDDGYGSITVEAGADSSLTGSVSPGSGRLDGIVFDANDASSHSAVVVDARPAWEQGHEAAAGTGDEPSAE